MLGREPTVILGALGELTRQIVPMLLLFGLINWTDPQIAAVFMVVSASIKVFEVILTRSQVTPIEKANAQIQIGIDGPSTASVGDVIRREKAIYEAKEMD